jgi:hypothetical protein
LFCFFSLVGSQWFLVIWEGVKGVMPWSSEVLADVVRESWIEEWKNSLFM